MATPARLEVLKDWRDGRPVGLLALGRGQAKDWRDGLSVDGRIDAPQVLDARRVFVGPQVEPMFETMVYVQARDRADAQSVVDEYWGENESGWSVYAIAPANRRRRMLLRSMLGAIRWTSRRPRTRTEDRPQLVLNMGGVNPALPQWNAMQEDDPQQPVTILNLNKHVQSATDPITGESRSGAFIAGRYFKEALRTFSALGARLGTFGSCRGTLRDDLGLGDFDQFGLVHYKTLNDYEVLIRIGAESGWDVYREAGLERSFVVHMRAPAC